MDIDDWRRKIDELNVRLLELFGERARCAIEIGKLKQAKNEPIFDPDREGEILKEIAKANPGPFSDKAIERIFKQIFQESRTLEKEENAKADTGEHR